MSSPRTPRLVGEQAACRPKHVVDAPALGCAARFHTRLWNCLARASGRPTGATPIEELPAQRGHEHDDDAVPVGAPLHEAAVVGFLPDREPRPRGWPRGADF